MKEFLVSKRSTEVGVASQLHFSDQCNVLFQIACALCFLADKNLVHRDVAARNCLVGAGIQVKLADFGLARGTGSDLYYRKLGGMVPIRWMSPEAILDGKYSVRSDIWSFGVLIWEVFTLGQLPFYGWSNDEVLEKIKEGWHLALPQNCPETVCEIMEWCWEQDAHQRITAEQLVQLFSRLMRHSSKTMNVPLSSLAEFASLVPSGRVRHTNEYMAEADSCGGSGSVRSHGTVLNSKGGNLMVSLDEDDVDIPKSMQSGHGVTKATAIVSDMEVHEAACQLPNGYCHSDSSGASSADHEKDSAIYLPSPRDVDSQGKENSDEVLSKAVFSELTAFFDSEV